ncbi:hypothetical protein GCM10027217_44410 [Pseudomaricurvus hydrocarbonicus]
MSIIVNTGQWCLRLFTGFVTGLSILGWRGSINDEKYATLPGVRIVVFLRLKSEVPASLTTGIEEFRSHWRKGFARHRARI